MTYDEVANKFKTCTEFAKWPNKKSDTITRFVRSLEEASDLRPLVEALTT